MQRGPGLIFHELGFPHVRHRCITLSLPFFTVTEWLVLLVKHCVLFVTEKMAHHPQRRWLLTDRLMKSEIKDLCSQHIPLFVFTTIHQRLAFRATFCLLKTCLERIPVHCVKSLRIWDQTVNFKTVFCVKMLNRRVQAECTALRLLCVCK